VSSLDDEACLGLVNWVDFYHKVGRWSAIECQLNVQLIMEGRVCFLSSVGMSDMTCKL